MKRFTLLLTLLLALVFTGLSQTISILEARARPVGGTVTVQGILTADRATMRWTGYMQDETAGIAFYNSSASPCATADSLQPGDIFTITGVLKDYNALLEISPINSITIISRNNPLPDPILVPVPNVGETYEGMLIRLSNVHFDATLQGTPFSGGSTGQNYDVTDPSGNVTQIRVLPSTDIPGTLIPFGNVNITGCLGQYSPSNPSGGYQLFPRSAGDMDVNSSIILTTPVTVSDLNTTSITLNWTTDNPGSSFVKYGHTTALELGTVTGAGNTTDHSVTLTGSASEMFYARAFSVSSAVATDTAKSVTGAFITESTSTGNIKVYFNTDVDHTVSSGIDAISIGQAVDDTLISYINRAKQSIDLAIYSFDNSDLSNISTALNSAANRGVYVRIIYCGTTANAGIDELNSSIHKLQGPGENNPLYSSRDGIMHDKFMIIDANSSDANDPLVWTGSFNWTGDNMNTDANNLIIVQDKSLAKTYLTEFEEMWGSTSLVPNAANAKFGSAKTNNTPHQLKIGGNQTECYFSPSDNGNTEIINRILSAGSDLEGAIMLITRREIAYAVSDAVNAGAVAKFLVNNYSDLVTGTTPDSTVFNTLKKVCAEFGDYTGGGVMHNKYLVVDQSDPASDPMVLTGSHNWSASANNYNDENILVIHNAALANIYYQNFHEIIKDADILYGIDDPKGFTKGDIRVYPNPVSSVVHIEVKAKSPVNYTVMLFDLSGRLVRESLQQAGTGISRTDLDVNGLMPGIYLLRLTNGNGSFVQKLVIQ